MPVVIPLEQLPVLDAKGAHPGGKPPGGTLTVTFPGVKDIPWSQLFCGFFVQRTFVKVILTVVDPH